MFRVRVRSHICIFNKQYLFERYIKNAVKNYIFTNHSIIIRDVENGRIRASVIACFTNFYHRIDSCLLHSHTFLLLVDFNHSRDNGSSGRWFRRERLTTDRWFIAYRSDSPLSLREIRLKHVQPIARNMSLNVTKWGACNLTRAARGRISSRECARKFSSLQQIFAFHYSLTWIV